MGWGVEWGGVASTLSLCGGVVLAGWFVWSVVWLWLWWCVSGLRRSVSAEVVCELVDELGGDVDGCGVAFAFDETVRVEVSEVVVEC